MQPRCRSDRGHVKTWLRKDLFSSSLTWLLTRFSSSQVVGLRASVPGRLLADGFPQFLPCGSPIGRSQHVTGFHQSEQARQQGRTPKTEATVSLQPNLRTSIPSLLPYLCPLEVSGFLSSVRVEPTLKERGIQTTVNARRWGSIEAIWKIVYHRYKSHNFDLTFALRLCWNQPSNSRIGALCFPSQFNYSVQIFLSWCLSGSSLSNEANNNQLILEAFYLKISLSNDPVC